MDPEDVSAVLKACVLRLNDTQEIIVSQTEHNSHTHVV